MEPYYLMRVKGNTISAANETMDSHKVEADGYITDAMVGGSAADVKILSLDGVEIWYFLHVAGDSDEHQFLTPIPIKAGQTIKLISVSAAAGTHYALILGRKAKLTEEQEPIEEPES